MATTSSTLRTATNIGGGVFVFAIDGAPIAATTANPVSLASAAWVGTPHAGVTFSGGLHIPGPFEQSINLIDSKVDWESLSITITDNQSDTLAGKILREAHTGAHNALLKADFDQDDTTMTVDSTTGWASSGTVYLGNNAYTYTNTTANTLTGCTPAYDLFAVDAGTSFTDFHAIPTDSSGGEPVVSDQLRSWYNRRVGIWFHHTEDGVLVTRANAKLLWAGRLKSSPKDNGDGSFTFQAWHIKEALNRILLEDQYQGEFAEGWWLDPAGTKIEINSIRLTSSPPANRNIGPTAIPFATTPSSAALRTVGDVRDGINEQLNTWAGADIWPEDMTLLLSADGTHRFRARMPDTTNSYLVEVTLTAFLWNMLGWPTDGTPLSNHSRILALAEAGSGVYELKAPSEPVYYQVPIYDGAQLTTTGETGTWVNQSTMPPGLTIDTAGNAPNGFLLAGDIGVIPVYRSGSTMRVVGDLRNTNHALAPLGVSVATLDIGRRAYSTYPIKFKQIWIENDYVGIIFSKLMYSSGLSGYNHASLDTYPRQLGLGIPGSLISRWGLSFLSTASYWLILTKPTPFLDLFEPMLQLRNAHLVWKDGTLQVKRLAGDVPAGAADWTLTEANKAATSPDNADRMTIERGGVGMVNRATLKFDADVNGDFRDFITIIDSGSVSDYGPSKPLEIKGPGVYRRLLGGSESGLADFGASVASLLGHFGKPAALAERSIDFSLFEMAPGDTVAITDNYAVAPTTGARGLTSWPGYVVSTSVNFADLTQSKCKLVLFTNVNTNNLATWGPSAQVASSAIVSSKLVLTCVAHQYSQSTDAADATYFPAGSKCLLFKLSEAAGTAYAVEVESQSGNDVALTTDPAGGALPTTSTWVLQFDDIGTVVAAQKAKSFIADSADTTTGDSTYTKYLWLGPVAPTTSTTVTYTQRYRKIVSAADNKGEPLSVHWFADAAQSANCIFNYKTAPHYLNHRFFTAVTQTGATRKLVLPPIFLNLYGGDSRALKFSCHFQTSAGTGTVRCVLSSRPVTGTSDTALTYFDGGVKYGEVSTTSTSLVYSAETSISNPFRTPDIGAPGGAWLTVEIYATAGDTVTLRWIGVREVPL